MNKYEWSLCLVSAEYEKTNVSCLALKANSNVL